MSRSRIAAEVPVFARALAGASLALLAGAAPFEAGCSSKNETPVENGANADFATNPDKDSCQAFRPVNDAFCNPACGAPKSCDPVASHPIDTCCVLVKTPSNGADAPYLTRTTDTKEYSGTGNPSLSCFDPATYPKAGTSKTVSMQGLVKIFANGCSSDGVTIELYTVKRTGGADDGAPDQLIGAAVTTDAAGEFVEETVSKCTDPRKDFKFTYEGVPTFTEFLIKTSGPAKGKWATLWDYNQYIADGDPEFDGTVYHHNARALAADDYQLIPSVSSLGRTITPGHGAIAGEIHDCGDVRLSNATAEVDVSRGALVYFTPDEDNPMPDTTRTQIGSTGSLGLYAALDVVPGPFTLAAAGLVEDPPGSGKGSLVSLGWYKAQVFPDSVTALSLRGLRPWQVPTK